jgi:hypothetical protein
MTDAVEKGSLSPERRKSFRKQASIENIDSSTLDFGFYYCPFLPIGRSQADFFDSRPFADLARCPLSGRGRVERLV